MATDPSELESTAKAYEDAAEKLREAARILRYGVATSPSIPPPPVFPEGNTRVSRRDQLVNWLRRHGPATRRQILEGAGMPQGTVAALLSSDEFERDESGRWSVNVIENGRVETIAEQEG